MQAEKRQVANTPVGTVCMNFEISVLIPDVSQNPTQTLTGIKCLSQLHISGFDNNMCKAMINQCLLGYQCFIYTGNVRFEKKKITFIEAAGQ